MRITTRQMRRTMLAIGCLLMCPQETFAEGKTVTIANYGGAFGDAMNEAC